MSGADELFRFGVGPRAGGRLLSPARRACARQGRPPRHSPIIRMQVAIDMGRRQLAAVPAGGSLQCPPAIPVQYVDFCTAACADHRKMQQGALGTVFRGFDPETGVSFAAQPLQDAGLATSYGASMAPPPETLFPNVLRVLGYCCASAADPRSFLLYELCPGGSVEEALADDAKAADLTWETRVGIACEVAEAMQQLRGRRSGVRGCVHRDALASGLCLGPGLHPRLIPCACPGRWNAWASSPVARPRWPVATPPSSVSPAAVAPMPCQWHYPLQSSEASQVFLLVASFWFHGR